tara:strand:+ start:62 stop:364 length:303 start_codon:yes stop_codon:yes gene_type:complete
MKYCSILIFLVLVGCAQKKYFYVYMKNRSFIEYKTSTSNPDHENIRLHANYYCKKQGKITVFDYQFIIAGQYLVAFECHQPEGGYQFFNDPIQIKPERVL